MRARRLPGRWLAAALGVAAVMVLAPGVSYVTASQSSPSPLSGPAPLSVQAAAGCRGVTPAVFPALGFITDPARTQGGHLWWRSFADGSTCLGTVVEWVQYNTTATKTWRVVVYSAQHPDGQTVAQQTFTAGRGWYSWGFGVHQAFQGLSAVCLTADESFGSPCISFVQSPRGRPTGPSTSPGRR